jgi:hypothetical protein
MLKMTARPKFTSKIIARVPNDDGHSPEEFRATFRVASDPDADMSTPALQNDFLRDIVVELHDIADETGTAIPYSDELLTRVLALPWAKLALIRGYFDAVTGARAGN